MSDEEELYKVEAYSSPNTSDGDVMAQPNDLRFRVPLIAKLYKLPRECQTACADLFLRPGGVLDECVWSN